MGLQAQALVQKTVRALGPGLVPVAILGPGSGPGALVHTAGRILEQIEKFFSTITCMICVCVVQGAAAKRGGESYRHLPN